LNQKYESYHLNIVSHTHWDREWYLSLGQFRHHFVKMMDRLLHLFEVDKDFKYFTMDGQYLVIKDYLEIRPEKLETLKKLIQEGKLIIGPWYTQPNLFMVSGESILRNLKLGIDESEKLGGYLNCCYLPDAFGYITQLPQIIQGFDMKDVVIWRGVDFNAETYFEWTGADGSRCNAFSLPAAYGNAVNFTIDNFVEKFDENLKSHKDKMVTPELLLMNGVDHSFAQEDITRTISYINNNMKNCSAKHTTILEYISNVKGYIAKSNQEVQQKSGELRNPVDILPDSQSMHTRLKLENSSIERLLEKWVESFSVYAWAYGLEYQMPEIKRSWEYLLENHAHDTLACCSIDEVYRQALTRFECSKNMADAILDDVLSYLARCVVTEDSKTMLTVFNPLNTIRNEVIQEVINIPLDRGIKIPRLYFNELEVPMAVVDLRETVEIRYNPLKGHPSTPRVMRCEITFLAENIPANGMKTYEIKNSEDIPVLKNGIITSHNTMENQYLIVVVNTNGTIDIIDKQTGKHYQSLNYFEDCGEAGDGFTRKKPMKDRIVTTLGSNATISITENNELMGEFQIDMLIELPLGISTDRTERSSQLVKNFITTTVLLLKGANRVDVKTKFTNNAKDHRFRVVFPSGIKTDYSYAEQPFDVIKRPIQSEDYVDLVHPQLSFAGVCDQTVGLMIANKGLYEYEVLNDNQRSIAITLLRGTNKMYEGAFAESEKTQAPQGQEIGKHIFEYSIIPHSESWENARLHAEQFVNPLRVILQQPLLYEVLPNYKSELRLKEIPVLVSFVQLSPSNLVISAVKKHDKSNSVIVRVWNPSLELQNAELCIKNLANDRKKAFFVNLKEERIADTDIYDGGIIKFQIETKKIITLEIPIDK